MHKILQAGFLLFGAFAVANYLLDWGFFGAAGKGILFLTMGAFAIYAAYFVPSRKDAREHGENVSNGR
jgi:hypothetical protein